MAMEKKKIKILGAILELPDQQHCQFSLFTAKMGQMGWIGSAVLLVAPKRPPGFWFFQWPWMPIIHLRLFPLRPVPPNLSDIINHFSAVWFGICIVSEIVSCWTSIMPEAVLRFPEGRFEGEVDDKQIPNGEVIHSWHRNHQNIRITFSWHKKKRNHKFTNSQI